ncbi:MAG: hypothetical protein ACFE8L_07205 [Candidatus Hodarchaeota archaeon]
MKSKEKLKCPVCNLKFIPRTFYPEEAIFSTLDGKKLSGFDGYISSSGVKPPEVVLGSWVTYCPHCNYVMKFAKELVKKEKIQGTNSKDVKEKYNSYYFGFPFEDYSQYLNKITSEISNKIQSSLNGLDISVWESMYEIDDKFKLLVRFIANLENFCDSRLNTSNNKDMPAKIKEMKFSADIEENLLDLNKIRNETVRGDYELSPGDEKNINKVIVNFILYLIKEQIESLLNAKKLKNKYYYVDLKDFNSEIKYFLTGYLNGIFHNDKSVNNQIQVFLDTLLENGKK